MTSASPLAQRSSCPRKPPSAALLQIRDVIYTTAGIFQPDNKIEMLEARCKKPSWCIFPRPPLTSRRRSAR